LTERTEKKKVHDGEDLYEPLLLVLFFIFIFHLFILTRVPLPARACVLLYCHFVLATLLPPIAVLYARGFSKALVVNLLLCVFTLMIGGIIHAWWVIGWYLVDEALPG
jgi:uncharacterized membrane protein YqaE (UPF0057 family)